MQTNRTQLGFTLIEVLLIAPIVVLLIGAFIGLVVTLTGDSLQQREKNTMAYDTQAALDTIEDDAFRATAFPRTIDTTVYPIVSPQGSNDVTANFSMSYGTTTGPLIIKSAVTTENPLSSTRAIVYYNAPNTCASANVSSNSYIPLVYIYFLNSGSLWRRVIMGKNYTTTNCGTSWQQPSCKPSLVNGGTCKAEDAKLLDNVTAFSLDYYTTSSDASPLISTDYTWDESNSPSTLTATLTASKLVGGKNTSYTGTLRVSSANLR